MLLKALMFGDLERRCWRKSYRITAIRNVDCKHDKVLGRLRMKKLSKSREAELLLQFLFFFFPFFKRISGSMNPFRESCTRMILNSKPQHILPLYLLLQLIFFPFVIVHTGYALHTSDNQL